MPRYEYRENAAFNRFTFSLINRDGAGWSVACRLSETVRHQRRRQRGSRCPYPKKNTFASLADRRGPTSSPGLVRRSWFLGPRQIGNYPFARTVASIEINWFFSTTSLSTVLAIFGLGRRRSRSWEPWRSARTPRDEEAPTRKRKAATSRRDSLASHESRYRADTTRVDDHDNHDKMGTKRDTPGKRRKKRGPIGRRSRRSLGRL